METATRDPRQKVIAQAVGPRNAVPYACMQLEDHYYTFEDFLPCLFQLRTLGVFTHQ